MTFLSLATLASTAFAGCAVDPVTAEATKQTESAEVNIDPRDPMSTVAAMEAIAKQHDGNRATGTAGGRASGNAIIETLKDLGLDPRIEEFAIKDSEGNDSGATGRNILVDLNAGASDEVLVVGAHYDSVEKGPGIVDNASGVATLLAAAAAQKDTSKWTKTVRLAFWDAEEVTSVSGGVQGAAAYVDALSDADAAKITGYINYDMTASKDGVLALLDNDRSTLGDLPAEFAEVFASMPPVPATATEFEESFAASLPADANTRQDPTVALSSDAFPFLRRGINVGGVSVMAEIVNENDELEFIPCYHKECDDLTKVDKTTLVMIADSAAALLPALAK